MGNRLFFLTWTAVFVFSVSTGWSQNTADWTTQADDLRGRNGQNFDFVCPAGGTVSNRLWGTDLYTDDSSICTAAVHAGLITAASGGTVTIAIRSGQSSYTGSTRHGVTSKDFGSWKGSFVLVELKVPLGSSTSWDAQSTDWTTQADDLRDHNGQTFDFTCPAGGTISSRLWGDDLYTDDSSICTAAVHAGLITAASGGSVTIEVIPGQSSYAGSTRHGVTSKNFGSWKGSFVFVENTGSGDDEVVGDIQNANWTDQAVSLRDRDGQTFNFTCPADGTISSRLWGDDLYTDDSSICTAAVHAGLITAASGGTVTIKISPGQSSYAGSTRHGVTSKNYGPWKGSFVFVAR